MKKIIITLLMITMLLFILMPYSNAALQSNGSAGTTQTIGSWMVNIRGMEALNGGMGLTETIGGNLTPTTESNNLDVHMQKNTEYGAMAILSASSYGNPNKIESGETTTGNKTGIVININKEWVAAGFITIDSTFTGANAKYKNLYEGSITGIRDPYTLSYTAKKGDTITETSGWHGSGSSTWLSSSRNESSGLNKSPLAAGLLRAYSGSLFSYYGYAYKRDNGSGYFDNSCKDDAYYTKSWYSRAAMVCGEGI